MRQNLAEGDARAARRVLRTASRRHGLPETLPSDGNAAKAAAIRGDNEAHGPARSIPQGHARTKVVEQDQRAVKRVVRLRRGFKAFAAAQGTLVGSERLHRLQQGHMVVEAGPEGLTTTAPF